MAAPSRYFDTIVVGAGISGLACAARLLKHRASVGSVAIIEARDRIGGRIDSVYINGNRLDTGANWIHGTGTAEKPNPLMHILPHKRYRSLSGMVVFRPPAEENPLNADRQRENEDWQDVPEANQWVPSISGGSLVIPAEYGNLIQDAVWRILEAVHELASDTPPSKAKLTDVISAVKKSGVFPNTFRELPSTYHGALGGILQFMESMEAAPLVAQSAKHTWDQDGMGLLEFSIDDFDGEQAFLQDGYIEIINEVAKELVEAGAIHLETEVREISWEENPIKIRTNKGTYEARNVVCSLPLGVLKHNLDHARLNAPSLFVPQLPRAKTEAISSLGFGTLDKIFMIYSKPWWIEEPYKSILKLGYVRPPLSEDHARTPEEHEREADSFWGFTRELSGFAIHEDRNISAGPRLLSLTNLHSLSGFPVLCAFVSCANAAKVEHLSDQDAGDLVHRALTTWFGSEPPTPDAVHVTRWSQDPHAFGSYSHMITGRSETTHREEFQNPELNSQGAALRFAGEHTSKNHFATVHGALLSGWREADAILKPKP